MKCPLVGGERVRVKPKMSSVSTRCVSPRHLCAGIEPDSGCGADLIHETLKGGAGPSRGACVQSLVAQLTAADRTAEG